MTAAVTVAAFLAMITAGGWTISRPALPGSRHGHGHVQGLRAPLGTIRSAVPGAVRHGASTGTGRGDHRDGGRGR